MFIPTFLFILILRLVKLITRVKSFRKVFPVPQNEAKKANWKESEKVSAKGYPDRFREGYKETKKKVLAVPKKGTSIKGAVVSVEVFKDIELNFKNGISDPGVPPDTEAKEAPSFFASPVLDVFEENGGAIYVSVHAPLIVHVEGKGKTKDPSSSETVRTVWFV